MLLGTKKCKQNKKKAKLNLSFQLLNENPKMEFEYNNFETWCQLCGTFEKSNAPDNFNECEIYQVLVITNYY